jgi:hypothetical protein
MNWAQEASRVPPDAYQAPTSPRMVKMSHVWPSACPSSSVMYELGSGSGKIQSASICMPMYKLGSYEAPRLPPATCQAPTSARMANMSHVWHLPCTSCSCSSVIYDWAQEASKVPPAACQASTSDRKAKMSHVWPLLSQWLSYV